MNTVYAREHLEIAASFVEAKNAKEPVKRLARTFFGPPAANFF
jgi:hypothetical protein